MVKAISAASILAKVHRDRWCAAAARRSIPHYGFAGHKGYGTPEHLEALRGTAPAAAPPPVLRPVARERLASEDGVDVAAACQ